jgi:hypothetical protein
MATPSTTKAANTIAHGAPGQSPHEHHRTASADRSRNFVTDALRSGLPTHIAAKICGHALLDTTMGYAAIYPEDVIARRLAFIARRRTKRPSEEHRDLTATEWDEFLAHFELRKVALGTCGRDFGNPCPHEACVRCPLQPHRPSRPDDPRTRRRRPQAARRLGRRRHSPRHQPRAGQTPLRAPDPRSATPETPMTLTSAAVYSSAQSPRPGQGLARGCTRERGQQSRLLRIRRLAQASFRRLPPAHRGRCPPAG